MPLKNIEDAMIGGTIPPVLKVLFDMLPPPGTKWPADDRVRWLRAAAAVVELLYGDKDGVLKITLTTRRGLADGIPNKDRMG